MEMKQDDGTACNGSVRQESVRVFNPDRPEIHPAMYPPHGKPLLRDHDRVQGMGRQADGDPGGRSAERNPVQGKNGAAELRMDTENLDFSLLLSYNFSR